MKIDITQSTAIMSTQVVTLQLCKQKLMSIHSISAKMKYHKTMTSNANQRALITQFNSETKDKQSKRSYRKMQQLKHQDQDPEKNRITTIGSRN